MTDELKPIEFLNAKQVADLLGYKEATIHRYTRQRKIDVIIIGRNHKYTREAVDKFITEHTLPSK
jgi:predicted DNA-binding transcriptional regulator AlpA